jgi:hypothetical protein
LPQKNSDRADLRMLSVVRQQQLQIYNEHLGSTGSAASERPRRQSLSDHHCTSCHLYHPPSVVGVSGHHCMPPLCPCLPPRPKLDRHHSIIRPTPDRHRIIRPTQDRHRIIRPTQALGLQWPSHHLLWMKRPCADKQNPRQRSEHPNARPQRTRPRTPHPGRHHHPNAG